jgi:hypothetical protein
MKLFIFAANFASLAQLVEQLIRNEQVVGSSPIGGSKIKSKVYNEMKKLLFSFLMLFCCLFLLNGQTNMASLIGEINSDYFIWETRTPKKGGIFAIPDHFLLKYDQSMNLITSARLDVLESFEQIENIILFGNRIIVFTSVFKKKETKQLLTYQLIDPATLKGQGEKIPLIEVDMPDRKIVNFSTFKLLLSDDGRKLMVIKEAVRSILKIVPKVLDVSVFDQNFTLLWNRSETLSVTSNKFSLVDYNISNEGGVLITGSVKYDKDTVDTKLLRNYQILKFTENGKKYSSQNLALEVANYKIIGEHLLYSADKIIAVGFFKIPEVKKQYGYFLQEYNLESMKREKNYYKSLALETEISGEDETDPDLKRINNKEADDRFAFEIKRIRQDDSGNIFLIGEQKNEYTATVTQQYGTTTNTTLYYLDIYVLKLDPDGKLIWEMRIPKRQVFSPTRSKNARNLYDFISYAAYLWNDNLMFFLNDNPEKMDSGAAKPKSVRWKDAISQVLIINKDGKVDRKPFSDVSGNLFYTDFLYILSNNRIMVRSSLFKEYEESTYKIIDLKQLVSK